MAISPGKKRTAKAVPAPAETKAPQAPVVEEQTETVTDPLLTPPRLAVFGEAIVELTHTPFKLTVYADKNSHTFVVTHNGKPIATTRALRTMRINTLPLHVAALARLAVNESECHTGPYLEAASFFDNLLQPYGEFSFSPVELNYIDGDRTGYVCYLGDRVVYDEQCTAAQQEVLFRAVQPVALYIRRRLHGNSSEKEKSLIDTIHMDGPKTPAGSW